jgi:hypothetical protein
MVTDVQNASIREVNSRMRRSSDDTDARSRLARLGRTPAPIFGLRPQCMILITYVRSHRVWKPATVMGRARCQSPSKRPRQLPPNSTPALGRRPGRLSQIGAHRGRSPSGCWENRDQLDPKQPGGAPLTWGLVATAAWVPPESRSPDPVRGTAHQSSSVPVLIWAMRLQKLSGSRAPRQSGRTTYMLNFLIKHVIN